MVFCKGSESAGGIEGGLGFILRSWDVDGVTARVENGTWIPWECHSQAVVGSTKPWVDLPLL
jgi:hypothetical protein